MSTEVAVTEGLYKLTIHDGSQRDVRVFEVSGELRMCFIEPSGMPCKDSATMLVTTDLELYRSPEQEGKDLLRIARSCQDDVGSQLNRISEIADGLASSGARSWHTVAELKRIYGLLQQLIMQLEKQRLLNGLVIETGVEERPSSQGS